MEMVAESMKMAPGALPRPGRVPEQRLLSPETCRRWRMGGATRARINRDELYLVRVYLADMETN